MVSGIERWVREGENGRENDEKEEKELNIILVIERKRGKINRKSAHQNAAACISYGTN